MTAKRVAGACLMAAPVVAASVWRGLDSGWAEVAMVWGFLAAVAMIIWGSFLLFPNKKE